MYRDFKGVTRPGQNKRSRGRNPNLNPNNQPNNNNNRPRMPNRMQTFDSNGPSVKIRGNAYQVFERYVALAREAASAGDRIAAENLYQHAEHYFRIMNANGDGPGNMMPRPTTPADTEMLAGPAPEVQNAHSPPVAEAHPEPAAESAPDAPSGEAEPPGM